MSTLQKRLSGSNVRMVGLLLLLAALVGALVSASAVTAQANACARRNPDGDQRSWDDTDVGDDG